MKQRDSSAFALPERLAAKANPELIAADERHFEAMTQSLEQTIRDLSDRLDKQLMLDEGEGQEAQLQISHGQAPMASPLSRSATSLYFLSAVGAHTSATQIAH